MINIHAGGVDGEHFLPDQAQVITGQQDFTKESGDFLVHGRNKVGNGCKVRFGVSVQGHEDDVFLTGLGDSPAGHDSPGIGKQDDLQQDLRIVGGGSRFFIPVAFIEDGSIKLMIDVVIEGIFHDAGNDLFLKMDGNEFTLCVGI